MSNDPHYIKVPTFEDELREKHKSKYDPRIFAHWRYRAAKPLLKLWEKALGKEIARSIGTIMFVGGQVLTHTRIRFYDEPNTHPQDREAYEAEIERLKNRLEMQVELYRRADEAARRGENLARALRKVDGLIDDNWAEKRHLKEGL